MPVEVNRESGAWRPGAAVPGRAPDYLIAKRAALLYDDPARDSQMGDMGHYNECCLLQRVPAVREVKTLGSEEVWKTPETFQSVPSALPNFSTSSLRMVEGWMPGIVWKPVLSDWT